MKKSFWKKEVVARALIVALCASALSACGSAEDAKGDFEAVDASADKTDLQDSAETDTVEDGDSEAEPEDKASTDTQEKELKEKVDTLDFKEIAKKHEQSNKSVTVGVVTSSGGIDDGSFNQSAWEGLQWLSGRNGCEVKFLESETEDDFYLNLETLVGEGGKLCWGIGYSCAEDVLYVAENNPDRNFAVVDYHFEDCPENVTGVMFRAEEPSFLVGYIAANVSEKHKVGFIGGYDTDIIDQFMYGYMAGIKYAESENGVYTEVVTEYADSYNDSDKGYEMARRMYEDGCDIIYHAAGETGLGVITAAKDTGYFCIGVDKDQAYLAPENVLTSALKYVNVAVQEVSEEYLNGGDIGGINISMGLREGAVGVSEIHSLYSESLYEDMLALSDRIKNDDLVPPYNEENYKEFVESIN